jgi:hypothetical protein
MGTVEQVLDVLLAWLSTKQVVQLGISRFNKEEGINKIFTTVFILYYLPLENLYPFSLHVFQSSLKIRGKFFKGWVCHHPIMTDLQS